jgi:tetratricopeptide (TPR) repeat protein
MKAKIPLIIFCLSFMYYNLSAISYFDQAEKLIMDNKAKDAVPLLEQAIIEDPQNEIVYVSLAFCYDSVNQPEKSIQTLEKGLRIAKGTKDKMYFSMGNDYYLMEKYKLAIDMFVEAIKLNGDFAKAYLNRANTYLQLVQNKFALNDYKHYLELAPDTPQRAEVEAIIKLLSESLSEEDRLAAEKAAKEKQLKDLLKTLDTQDNMQNMSVGTDKMNEKYSEGDIVE